MSNFCYLKLKEIEQRPQIFLGDPSLEKIKAFIDGYTMRELEINPQYRGEWLSGFQEYIQAFYHVDMAQGWPQIIEFHTFSRQEAIELFFKRVDEYEKCRTEEHRDTAGR